MSYPTCSHRAARTTGYGDTKNKEIRKIGLGVQDATPLPVLLKGRLMTTEKAWSLSAQSLHEFFQIGKSQVISSWMAYLSMYIVDLTAPA